MSYLEIHDRSGARYVPTDHCFTLGRGLSNTIVLQGSMVSRMHARISWQGEQVVLQDLRSTHGTQVNGRYIHGDAVLRDGDRVQMGDVYFVFRERPDGDARLSDVTPPSGTARPRALAASALAAPAPRLAPNMVHCPYCRTPNLRTNSVCFNCGSALLIALERGAAGHAQPAAWRDHPSSSGWLTGFLVALALLVLCALGVLLGLLLASAAPAGMV